MYYLKKSQVDSSFVEICIQERVEEEIEFLHPLRKSPLFHSIEEAKCWLLEEERKRARRKAIYTLARQDIPREVLFRKLKMQGFSDLSIEQALENLPFDDAAFWERVIEREWKKGHGPYRIEAKWLAKGMPKRLAISKISTQMQEEKIRSEFIKSKDCAKTARSLMSKGFETSLVEKIFRQEQS